MKTYFRENLQFIIICLVWIGAGVIYNPIALVLVPITALLLSFRNFETELFLGFLFVLTMSDSRLESMAWAGEVKSIYIVLFSLATLRTYKLTENPIKLHVYILPFILIAGLCLFFSPIPLAAAQKTLSYFLLFFSVTNYFAYLYQQEQVDFIKRIVWMLTSILFIGLIFKFTSPTISVFAGRFRGLLGNPNGLGIYCFLFTIFFTITNEFFPNLFTRNQKIFIYSIALISLIYSGARSSTIALFLFFIFRYFHKLSPIFGFMLLIVIIGSYELITSNFETIITVFGLNDYFRIETLKDGSGRYVAWNFAWQHIEKNYFLGKGFSYNEYLFRENYIFLLSQGHQGSSAHNSYLTFWLDTGLIGLVSFFSGLLAFTFSISKYSISIFPLLYSVLFSNQFESWLTASLNPFTMLFLLSISLIFVAGTAKQHIKEDEEQVSETEILLPA